MIQLANTSNQHLLSVLEIFSNFQREFDDLQIQESDRAKVIFEKHHLLESIDQRDPKE